MDERRKNLRDKNLNDKVIWQRDNVVGIAFADAPVTPPLPSDFDERLRKSEAKKRELQLEIQRLLGK